MKAILVFDINDLTYEGIKDGFINELTLHLRDNGFYEIKEVELKPMPEIISKENIYWSDIERDTWNACIDEILGE